MNKLLLSALTLMLTPALSYAIFCPKNFNQIYPGDSPEKVTAVCGKPDSQTEAFDEPLVPQEWNYYIPQSLSLGTPTPQTGTLKTTFAFDDKGKVININVNGIGIGATTICGGKNLQLGDTQDTVKAACGAASFISKQPPELSSTSQQMTKIITFTYNANPPVTLTFKNGQLTQ